MIDDLCLTLELGTKEEEVKPIIKKFADHKTEKDFRDVLCLCDTNMVDNRFFGYDSPKSIYKILSPFYCCENEDGFRCYVIGDSITILDARCAELKMSDYPSILTDKEFFELVINDIWRQYPELKKKEHMTKHQNGYNKYDKLSYCYFEYQYDDDGNIIRDDAGKPIYNKIKVRDQEEEIDMIFEELFPDPYVLHNKPEIEIFKDVAQFTDALYKHNVTIRKGYSEKYDEFYDKDSRSYYDMINPYHALKYEGKHLTEIAKQYIKFVIQFPWKIINSRDFCTINMFKIKQAIDKGKHVYILSSSELGVIDVTNQYDFSDFDNSEEVIKKYKDIHLRGYKDKEGNLLVGNLNNPVYTRDLNPIYNAKEK